MLIQPHVDVVGHEEVEGLEVEVVEVVEVGGDQEMKNGGKIGMEIVVESPSGSLFSLRRRDEAKSSE